eukprot:2733611-Amphidinium_carterae.1
MSCNGRSGLFSEMFKSARMFKELDLFPQDIVPSGWSLDITCQENHEASMMYLTSFKAYDSANLQPFYKLQQEIRSYLSVLFILQLTSQRRSRPTATLDPDTRANDTLVLQHIVLRGQHDMSCWYSGISLSCSLPTVCRKLQKEQSIA